MNLPEQTTAESRSTLPYQQRRWLVSTVVAIHVLLLIGQWYESRLRGDPLPAWMKSLFEFSLVGYLVETCPVAQPLLLSAWLLWGRNHLAVRLCALAAFPWALIWCLSGAVLPVVTSNMGWILVFFSIPIAILGLIRLIGYQLVDLRFPIEARPNQFSIRQLLLVSFVLGAWLSVVRWSIDGEWKSLFQNFSRRDMLQLAGIELLATAALVAGLIDGKRVRLVLVLGLLGIFLPTYDASLPSNYELTLKYGLATSAIVLCSVLPVRWAGYRLRRGTST